MIRALFENYDTAKVYGLHQWDYGQVLRIEGLKLPTAIEIHFSLQETGGEAVTRIGVTKDSVTDVVIPDSMLENNATTQDYTIYAYIYLADANSGQTIKKITMPVTARPRPEVWDTPEDADLFREAIAAVNESADRAEKAAESIEGYVDTAKADIDEYVAGKESELRGEPGAPGAPGEKGDPGEPGQDGYTPQKGVDYFDGEPGEPGQPGTTPHIGDNNHWYIGDTDTGVDARGTDGITPHIGENGHWWIGDVDTGVVAGGGGAVEAAQIAELKSDLDTLFENIIPLFSNVTYISDGMNVYLDNLRNRVNQNPEPEPEPDPSEPAEPALYSFVNGTHTFADGSILTVSNGNHVKLECKTTSTVNSGKNPFFGISDIQNANYGTSNALYNSTSTYSTDPMFTIDSGDLVEIWAKNVSSTNNKHSFKLNMRTAVQNGGGVIPDSFSVNYTMDSTVSKTFEASSNKNIAPFYVFFNHSEADVVYEFDVELFVNGTRFI